MALGKRRRRTHAEIVARAHVCVHPLRYHRHHWRKRSECGVRARMHSCECVLTTKQGDYLNFQTVIMRSVHGMHLRWATKSESSQIETLFTEILIRMNSLAFCQQAELQ